MTTPFMTVDALLVGTPMPFRGDDHSAIAKQPVSGPVRIGWDGFAGDAVADRVHHGGWDKAIHLYPHCLLYTSPSPRDGLLSRKPA